MIWGHLPPKARDVLGASWRCQSCQSHQSSLQRPLRDIQKTVGQLTKGSYGSDQNVFDPFWFKARANLSFKFELPPILRPIVSRASIGMACLRTAAAFSVLAMGASKDVEIESAFKDSSRQRGRPGIHVTCGLVRYLEKFELPSCLNIFIGWVGTFGWHLHF